MAIIKRSAIYNQNTNSYLYLPPYSLTLDIQEISVIEIEENPITHKIKEIDNQRIGWDLGINGVYKFSTDYDALLWQQEVRAFLRANGIANKFDVVDWNDTTGTIKRFYRNCYLKSDVSYSQIKSERLGKYSLSFVSSTPNVYVTDTDDGLPANTGPYEYLYPSSGAGESGQGTGSGIEVVIDRQNCMANFIFDNLIDAACGVTNVHSRQKQVILDKDYAVSIKSIQVTGGGPLSGSSGSTVVVVSNQNYTQYATASKLSASVAYDTNFSTLTTGSITIPANGTVYVYVQTATGGHSDLEVSIAYQRI